MQLFARRRARFTKPEKDKACLFQEGMITFMTSNTFVIAIKISLEYL
jgi:hypothetical protein